MKNTVSFFSLINGLTGDTSKLVIDEYQRNYVWTKDRAINLLKTIISANDDVFIGSFTIFKPAESYEVQIVDGQQRLVTIYIIMKCLRDIMIENREAFDKIFSIKSRNADVTRIERAYNDLIDDKYSGEFKLSFRKKETEEDFDAVIRQGKKSKYKNSQIERNYNALKNYLLDKNKEALCDAYLHLLNTVKCTSMECDSQIEAYRTFASINGLGQKVDDKYSIINIIFQNLGRANKDVCNLIEDADKSFMNRFLFNKTDKWVGRNDIISSFTKYIDSKNPETVVREILDFGEYDKKCYKYIKDKYLMPIPAMRVVVNYLSSKNFSDKEISRISKIMSAIFMRMQITPGTDHITETNTASIITRISKEDDIYSQVNLKTNNGRFFYTSDDVFKSSLMKYDIYHSSILKDYILYAINDYVSNSENFLIQDPSIEHISPQRDNKDNPLLHTIGNLTLTDKYKNSIMGVKEFSRKKEILLSSVYAINKYFENINEWNNDEIIKRGEYLTDLAAKIWTINQ